MKQLVGPRTSTIEFTDIGYDPITAQGPKFVFIFDRLYPGEIIEIRQWVEIPADDANRLTLRDAGLSLPTAFIYSQPAKSIDCSFFTGLYRGNWSDNTLLSLQTVEEFGGIIENELTQVWWELAPI